MWAVGALFASARACSSPARPDLSAAGDVGSTTTAVAPVPAGDPTAIAVSLPAVPPIALPDVSVLGETGDLVADRLGELVAPASGVDLIAAGHRTGGSRS